jgi:hypothetical protein
VRGRDGLAPRGFPVEVGGFGELHWPLLKGPHAALGSVARQEVRVPSKDISMKRPQNCRSLGLAPSFDFYRDDIFLGTRIPYQNMNCHPDRSAAKRRDLRFYRLVLEMFSKEAI